MNSDNDNISVVISTKKRRLDILLKQQAYHGLFCPPHVVIEIEDLRQEIAQLDRQIGDHRQSDIDSPESYAELGFRYYKEVNYELAIHNYTKSIHLHPNSKAFQRRAEAYVELYCSESRKKASKTITFAHHVLQPFSEKAYVWLLEKAMRDQTKLLEKEFLTAYSDACHSIVYATTPTEEKEMRQFRIKLLAVYRELFVNPIVDAAQVLREDVRFIQSHLSSNKEQYKFMASYFYFIYNADKWYDQYSSFALSTCLETIASLIKESALIEQNFYLPLMGHLDAIHRHNRFDNKKLGQVMAKELGKLIQEAAKELSE